MGNRALILVDIQNDFMPWGSLPTVNGDEVIPVANELASKFDLVAATQDWHPPNHVSFASSHEGKRPFDEIEAPYGLRQTLWPDHCVQGSEGAELATGLDVDAIDEVFHKGTDPEVDSYSGFFDNGRRNETGLEAWLHAKEVTDVYIAGVATEVCVELTALDARQLGFETYVVEDATRGVEAREGDTRRALERMREAGCHIVRSEALR